ncbi:MAG: hypothetical protein D6730_14575 [Bacteroidetes bacterium]|nr:MAG: hypothetical protein D6730_14575 [Bacteroidota bacterium]
MKISVTRFILGVAIALAGALFYEWALIFLAEGRVMYWRDLLPSQPGTTFVKLLLASFLGFFMGAFLAGVIESSRGKSEKIELGSAASVVLITVGTLTAYLLLGVFM